MSQVQWRPPLDSCRSWQARSRFALVPGCCHDDHAGVDGPLYFTLQPEEPLAAEAHRHDVTAHCRAWATAFATLVSNT